MEDLDSWSKSLFVGGFGFPPLHFLFSRALTFLEAAQSVQDIAPARGQGIGALILI